MKNNASFVGIESKNKFLPTAFPNEGEYYA